MDANRPKRPIPDGKRAAATNRGISVGFGAGASVRRRARERPQPPDLCSRPQPRYTRTRIAHTPSARPITRFPAHAPEEDTAAVARPSSKQSKTTTGQSWLQKGERTSPCASASARTCAS